MRPVKRAAFHFTLLDQYQRAGRPFFHTAESSADGVEARMNNLQD
jgi:hypothetical protein